jgi:mannosyltransferase OCH1-like enzyme
MKIHRLWLGPEDMPLKYEWYADEWQRLNPDCEVHDWSESNLPPLLNQEVYDDIGTPDWGQSLHPISVAVQRADVVGYELVLKYGGIYVNCDIQPVRPLAPLLELVGDNAWACREDEEFVVNAAIGGPAGHPFWQEVVDRLSERYWRYRRGPMNEVTGPHLLTAVWKSWKQPGFVVLPQETFNPVPALAIPMFGDAEGLFQVESLPSTTIGVHHWGHRLTGRPNSVVM